MDSLVFFGSLRSKKLFKIIIGNELNHLEFYYAKIFKAKLFKVKNENFPYLEKSELKKDYINCLYVRGLTKENFEKIIFYESIEYRLNAINILLNNKIIKTNYFELIKKNKSKEPWIFKDWLIKYENISCIAAKEWMTLFNKFKNNPEKAETYWGKMLLNAKNKIVESK